MRRATLVACTLVAALLPTSAGAQDGVQHAIEEMRAASLEACAELPEGRLVVRVHFELPDAAPDPNGLVDTIVRPTVQALSEDPRFDLVHLARFGRDGTHPAVLAERLGYDALLDVVLMLGGPELVLEGRFHGVEPPHGGASFVRRIPLDGALRQYVGFPTILTDEGVSARSVRLPGREYIALAVGDLSGDGRPEIVAVRRGEAHVVRLAGRRVRLVGRAGFSPSLPRAASPRRRAVGTAVFDDGRVVVRTSDFGTALAVRLRGGVAEASPVEGPCEQDRFPVMGGCAALVPGRDFFDEILTHHAAPYDEAPANFYSYAFGQYSTRAGEPTHFEALITPTGRLAMRIRWERAGDGDTPEIRERSAGAVGYGTALAMSDLDIDGSAEVLVSHAAPAGSGDQLSLLRALPRGALRVMWRSDPVGGSIWIATAGDVDGDGTPELLAIEEPSAGRGRASLWIVH